MPVQRLVRNCGCSTNQIRLGALLQFIMGAAGAGVALALYPVLRRQHAGLALAAVGFRLMEAVIFGISAAGLLSLVTLRQEPLSAGAAAVALLRQAWRPLAEPMVGRRRLTADNRSSAIPAPIPSSVSWPASCVSWPARR